jgi:hypothetical protein
MKVALDYDETFTKNPVLFRRLLRVILNDKSIEVKFVTWRHFTAEGNAVLESVASDLGIGIIYCAGRQKQLVCDTLGWKPDIWVDDNPLSIPLRHDLEVHAITSRLRERDLDEVIRENNIAERVGKISE